MAAALVDYGHTQFFRQLLHAGHQFLHRPARKFGALDRSIEVIDVGLVVALVLAGAGMSRVKAFLIGAASGLVEPVFAVLCAWLVTLAEVLLPLGLALAAGAMLLVVTHEVIPESRRNGHEKLASLGLCSGFCLMMVMDTALG